MIALHSGGAAILLGSRGRGRLLHGLQNLLDNLLLFDEERTEDALFDLASSQDTAICAVDSLLVLAKTSKCLRAQRRQLFTEQDEEKRASKSDRSAQAAQSWTINSKKGKVSKALPFREICGANGGTAAAESDVVTRPQQE